MTVMATRHRPAAAITPENATRAPAWAPSGPKAQQGEELMQVTAHDVFMAMCHALEAAGQPKVKFEVVGPNDGSTPVID